MCLRDALQRTGSWSVAEATRLDALKASRKERLSEKRAEIEENDERRTDHMQDEWKERYYEERFELENGRFADVDESRTMMPEHPTFNESNRAGALPSPVMIWWRCWLPRDMSTSVE